MAQPNENAGTKKELVLYRLQTTKGDLKSARLHVTYHHNWFADFVNERMPRVMYGQRKCIRGNYGNEGYRPEERQGDYAI